MAVGLVVGVEVGVGVDVAVAVAVAVGVDVGVKVAVAVAVAVEVADRYAQVDRTLAERAHEIGRRFSVAPSPPGRGGRDRDRSRLLDPMTSGAEGSVAGSSRPRVLPPLEPRILPRDRAGREHWDKPWDQQAYVRSLDGRTVYSTVRDVGVPMRILSMPIELQVQQTPLAWAFSAVVLTVLATGTAWFCARRASRMVIADALRHV